MTARSTSTSLVALLAVTVTRVCMAAHGGPMAATDAAAPEAVTLADGLISMDQAVKMAEHRFNARVVRAESENDGGKLVYVLRLLNESGRVWTVRVDAATGAVI